MGARELWDRFCEHYLATPELGVSLDVSRMRFEQGYLARMEAPLIRALDAMEALEAGGIANPDERRRVGHYWLRAPELAPEPAIAADVREAVAAVRAFARDAREGVLRGADGRFDHVIHVGIGGSALGPELLVDALGDDAAFAVSFLDNADPDGVDRVLSRRRGALGRTLVSVVSKCGATPTPIHVATEVEAAYARAGLSFADHAVATTMRESELDRRAVREGWLARFPLWDWVGGRTSVTSAVGLLPAALAGADVLALLEGAAAMDRRTRRRALRENPAAMLAAMWFWAGRGRGEKAMVILPYRDRLALFPRWAQQLVMESIGKRLDRSGRIVHQGLTVYGHKGSTDQHAYVQQLREGRADFFVTFIRTDEERAGELSALEPGVTLGDYLFGYLEGTRAALYERGRDSITLALPDASASSLGALIALYERAVGLYAELVEVNAYHQPGVDKHAASRTIALQRMILAYLLAAPEAQTADAIAAAIGCAEEAEAVYRILARLARDPRRGVVIRSGTTPALARFGAAQPNRVAA